MGLLDRGFGRNELVLLHPEIIVVKFNSYSDWLGLHPIQFTYTQRRGRSYTVLLRSSQSLINTFRRIGQTAQDTRTDVSSNSLSLLVSCVCPTLISDKSYSNLSFKS